MNSYKPALKNKIPSENKKIMIVAQSETSDSSKLKFLYSTSCDIAYYVHILLGMSFCSSIFLYLK